jgi:hypothetical protein
MLLLFLLFSAFLFSLETEESSIVQKCVSLTATTDYRYFGSSNDETFSSVDVKIFQKENETWISVSNVFFNDTSRALPDYICANRHLNIIDQDPQICSSSLNETFEFPIYDPYFYLYAHYSAGYFSFLLFAFVDDGTISYGDGSFFTPQQNSYSYQDSNRNSNTKEIQTCTSFVSAPSTNNTAAPKCKAFRSRISVLNVDDNYSIYATATINYILNENNITMSSNFTGPSEYFLIFWINDGLPCES